MPTLLTISGSLRADSVNRKLLAEAARLYEGAKPVEADLRLPLYDGDLEARGMPASVVTLANKISCAEAVVISTPEYNQSISGVLKNALDWVSRTKGSPWLDKPVAIMSAAAGRAGGARGQYVLRLAMAPFRPRLINGPEILVAGAMNEFDEHGRLTNDHYLASLTEMMERLKAETKRA